jgi:hypothetical protein
MPGTQALKVPRSRALLAAVLPLALLGAGCAGNNGAPPAPAAAAPDSAHGYAGSGSIADLFTGSSAKAPQTVAGAQPDVNCPPVEVRQGASTLTIGPAGAMTVRYQGSFTQEARDCAVANGNMVMRIGIQGRVVVGPGGGPGQVDVPLRIAVVQETPGGSRPITTKFVRIPVAVGNEGIAQFSHVEEGVTFPVPTPTSALDDYIAYVGFDPLSAQAQDQQKPKPAPKPRGQAKPSASTN